MNTINTADWSVLQLDGVADVTRKAAAKVAHEYRGVTEFDDLHQDAVIILASHPDVVRGYVDRNELGLLHRWLWCRLTDLVRPEAAKKNRQLSYENLRERAA